MATGGAGTSTADPIGVRLLLDMNLSPDWLPFLQQTGRFEPVHWSQVGKLTATDREIMDFARAGNFVVLTQDLDFTTILALTHADGPSVVQIRAQNSRPERIGNLVVATLRRFSAELLQGAILTIESKTQRLRLLPIGRN